MVNPYSMKGLLLLFTSTIISLCTMSSQALVDHQQTVGRVSIVTGASGYLGRLVMKELIEDSCTSIVPSSHQDKKYDSGIIMNENPSHEIISLVRETRIRDEEQYWSKVIAEENDKYKALSRIPVDVIVKPYDMVSQFSTLLS